LRFLIARWNRPCAVPWLVIAGCLGATALSDSNGTGRLGRASAQMPSIRLDFWQAPNARGVGDDEEVLV
jgi:hypothetical protein